jgi:acetyltransferase
MESIGNPRSFLSAAKEVAFTKPIIVIKAGKTKESALAASSHTGALTGSDEVLNVAFRRVGVLRVNSIADLFYMADILSKQPRPKGPNLSIITNAGGPGVIATDALIKSGGKLSKISKDKMEELNGVLPKEWSHNNPIDILGDATPEIYSKTVEIIAKDENSDGILVILTPQYMTDPKGVANVLKPFSKGLKKPLIASFMGEEKIEKGDDILANSNIPNFPYPDVACEAFSYMWNYSYNLKEIYETPLIRDEEEEKILKKRKKISKIFEGVLKDNRTLLDERESKEVLEAFDIPTVLTKVAKSKEEAKEIAKDIGFPVVLKVYSKTITHKSDVGGVKLNLKSEGEVEKAFQEIFDSVKKFLKEEDFQGVTVQKMVSSNGHELILGSSTDSQFGPVILFGMGGKLVEVFKDRSLALPPLNSTLANHLMERTRIFQALKGVRGEKGIDLNFLETVLIRFSKLISEYPIIKECDINPLLATPDEIIVLDARVVLYKEGEKRINFAIRPYPVEYIKLSSTKEGIPITFRPIKPEDEFSVSSFLETISKETILKELDYEKLFERERLIKMCFTDYDREMTLIAEVENKGEKEVIALSRLIKILNTEDAIFSMVVKKSWRGKKVGSNFLKYLIDVAKKEKIKIIKAKILKKHFIMQKIFEELNFKMRESKCGKMIYVEVIDI